MSTGPNGPDPCRFPAWYVITCSLETVRKLNQKIIGKINIQSHRQHHCYIIYRRHTLTQAASLLYHLQETHSHTGSITVISSTGDTLSHRQHHCYIIYRRHTLTQAASLLYHLQETHSHTGSITVISFTGPSLICAE